MRRTFHLTPVEVWDARPDDAPYTAPSLADEGFIHCTDGHDEMVRTANRHYREDPRPFVVLTVDLDGCGSPWTVEDPAGIYPHVHGPIEWDAILAVRPMPRNADGAFLAFADPTD